MKPKCGTQIFFFEKNLSMTFLFCIFAAAKSPRASLLNKSYIVMRTILLSILFALNAMVAGAQTQQGYVKTKGRLTNTGTYVKGTPLAGVTVSVRGRNAVLSKGNGTFSFVVPGGLYYLQNVQKQGYILSDPDILNRQYEYSKNPLVLVLEDKAQQAADLKAVERRISSNLYAQLQRRSEEIERLKEQNKITESRYQELLEQLNTEQESNEQIVKEMANAYVRMDFDQIDAFYRQVSTYILNGELLCADSMLNTKGNVSQNINQQIKKGQELAMAERRIQKAKAEFERGNDELAQRCYSKYQIFKLQHQNDSAAFYLEERARIDSTRVNWLLVAGEFLINYKADADGALSYFQKALRHAKDSIDYRMTYNNIGSLYHDCGHYAEALEYMLKSLDYFPQEELAKSEDIPSVYTNISAAYKKVNDIDNAMKYSEQALKVSLDIFGPEHAETANCYNSLGRCYSMKEDKEREIDCYKKALAIYELAPDKYGFELSTIYNNMGSAYSNINDYQTACDYYEKSLKVRIATLGENHPRVADQYNNLGVMFLRMKKYDDALKNYEKAMELWSKSKATRHLLVDGYGNLGIIYQQKGDMVKALESFEKGEEIADEYFKLGEADAKIFEPYIYMSLAELAPTSEEYKQRYQHFMDDKAIVGLVFKGSAAPTTQRGMEGVYYILKFDNWDIDSPRSFFDKEEELTGKPKDIVFLQGDQIREEHFDNKVGCGWRIYPVTPEQKQNIRDNYTKWKTMNK